MLCPYDIPQDFRSPCTECPPLTLLPSLTLPYSLILIIDLALPGDILRDRDPLSIRNGLTDHISCVTQGVVRLKQTDKEEKAKL